jgi:hypothetical protein
MGRAQAQLPPSIEASKGEKLQKEDDSGNILSFSVDKDLQSANGSIAIIHNHN